MQRWLLGHATNVAKPGLKSTMGLCKHIMFRNTTSRNVPIQLPTIRHFHGLTTSWKPSYTRIASPRRAIISQHRIIPSLITTSRRFYTPYERPFAKFKPVLDALLVGNRGSYVRPSVTYAAGIGNTALRSTRLHAEDYLPPASAWQVFKQLMAKYSFSSPGLLFFILTWLFLGTWWLSWKRTSELYEKTIDSIFAVKANNFIRLQGEKVFLETLIIMLRKGIIIPLNHPNESSASAAHRFEAELSAMVAEIEHHRDYKLCDIPLNVFDILQSNQDHSFLHKFELFLSKPMFKPLHKLYEERYGEIYTDNIDDLRKIHLDQVHPFFSKGRQGELDSSTFGALYGFFAPILFRYQDRPIELTAQAAPLSWDRDIRWFTGHFSKMVGRVRDYPNLQRKLDQHQIKPRYPDSTKNDFGYEVTHLHEAPPPVDLTTGPPAHYGDTDRELYPSFYVQRALNMIKQVVDVESRVNTSNIDLVEWLDSITEFKTEVMASQSFQHQISSFEPGDTAIFRYYFHKNNLVPYLNSLQYEMQELIFLRQRLSRLAKAVGVDPSYDSFSTDVLDLFRSDYDVDDRKDEEYNPDGTLRDKLKEKTAQPWFWKRYFIEPETSPQDTLQKDILKRYHDKYSIIDPSTIKVVSTIQSKRRTSRFEPTIPVPTSDGVSSLYKPVVISNLVNAIEGSPSHLRGLTFYADSLFRAQFTQTPRYYPSIGRAPQSIDTRQYIQALYSPSYSVNGDTIEEKYVRGLIGLVDLSLLRDAAEYSRWVYMVPDDTKSVWGQVKDYLLPNRKYPLTYEGKWKPFSYYDNQPFEKPVYYLTPLSTPEIEEEQLSLWQALHQFPVDSVKAEHFEYAYNRAKQYIMQEEHNN